MWNDKENQGHDTFKNKLECFKIIEMITIMSKVKLHIKVIILLVSISLINCKNISEKQNKKQKSQIDSIDFEKDWANLKDPVYTQLFPKIFPDIKSDFISYYYYGFNGTPNDSNNLYINMLVIRAFDPSIFIRLYRNNNNYFYEVKINSSVVEFDRIKYRMKKEIPKSVFNNCLSFVDSIDFYQMDINYEEEYICDGSTYFFEIRKGNNYHYIIRKSPFFRKEKRERSNEKELIMIGKLASELFELSDCKKIFEPIY